MTVTLDVLLCMVYITRMCAGRWAWNLEMGILMARYKGRGDVFGVYSHALPWQPNRYSDLLCIVVFCSLLRSGT